MSTCFPALPEPMLNAVNLLGGWLAENDVTSPLRSEDIGLVVLAGNAVIPTIDAACKLAADSDRPLLISGGIGHSTTFLYQAIAQHPHYCVLQTAGRPEAAILADVAHQFWDIPRERILVEDRSTNCGENAQFTRDMMLARKFHCRGGVVVQDPTMQRRTMATFARVWQGDAQAPRWRSYPGFVPVLHNTANGLAFCGAGEGTWPVDRYLSLILGELPRLQDNVHGYGPRGKGFIAHVDIPADVQAAWDMLSQDEQLADALNLRSLG